MATESNPAGERDRTAPTADPSRSPPEAVKVVDRRWWVRDEEGLAPGETWEPPKPSYVEQLEKQLADKDEQLRETITKYKAAAAEFDAVRVRLRRDVTKEIERGRRALLVELLDVVDNLDRAVGSAAAPGTSVEALVGGVEMVRDLFLAKLDGFGVRRMAALGEPFDPERHEAITVVPVATTADDGRVVGIVAEGYLVGDEVLRPARVAVARLEEA